MEMGTSGIYKPKISQVCEMKQCNLCATSCPFWNQNLDEAVLAQKVFRGIFDQFADDSIGIYTNLYSGYVIDQEARFNSASGGLATWLLIELLEIKEVDYVICVTSMSNSNAFFGFSVFSDVESLKKSSGSCYYPVHLADVIQYIRTNPGRYAITGLPCYIKALRLIMLRNRIFSERVKFLIGLVCGQTQSKYFVEYLFSMVGGNPKDLTQIKFRLKDPDKSVNNFGVRFFTVQPGKTKDLFWNEGVKEAWLKGYFRPKACDFCDDVFAELADVTFMDAWLPEFSNDSAGTNLVIVRSAKVEELFIRGRGKGVISIANVSPEKVKQSQRGVIHRKKELLATRLALTKTKGYIPQKRVTKACNVCLRTSINYWLTEWIRKTGGLIVNNRTDDLYGYLKQKTAIPEKVMRFYKKLEKIVLRKIKS